MSANKFTARYPGRCPACWQSIDVGDELVFEDDQAVHLECAGRDEKPTRRPICPRCSTETSVSGACSCDES